jgi:hypothetical protein
VSAGVGDLVFYRPYSRAREMVPVLVSAEVREQKTEGGVVRILAGDVLEITDVLGTDWLLARYPGVEGRLLVDGTYCEPWKRADERVADV